MTEPLTLLKTSAEVIAALGGRNAVAELCGMTQKRAWQTVSNWLTRGFPSENFDLMYNALRSRGYDAPKSLWKQIGYEKSEHSDGSGIAGGL